ncbi:hypothetical protein CZP2022_125 [Vibrio phage C-ZP2022]|nr:hypothetical protein CZP2022_125 [Vibrio phage C-ZP2022]
MKKLETGTVINSNGDLSIHLMTVNPEINQALRTHLFTLLGRIKNNEFKLDAGNIEMAATSSGVNIRLMGEKRGRLVAIDVKGRCHVRVSTSFNEESLVAPYEVLGFNGVVNRIHVEMFKQLNLF